MIRSEAPTVDPHEVRAALGRVVASRRFRNAPKLAGFLRFVVEAALSGRSIRLKGYTIGVEALGRPESFDPQTDPIVRVEALRLRRALTGYYATEGADDPLLIDLPLGTYVPAFRRRERSALEASAPRLVRALRTVTRLLQARVAVRLH
jgi:hypothetical protein